MPWKDRTLVSIREEFVLKALEPRTNLAALCREFGVSRKTGYKWVERYKSGGVLALRDLSRRPRTSPLGVSREVVVDLVAIRIAHPRWGARKLIWALERSGAKSIPAERTVNRVLERSGLIVARRTRPKRLPPTGKPDVKADEPLRPDPPFGLVVEPRHRAPPLSSRHAGGQRRTRTDARRHGDGVGGPARGDHRGPAPRLRPLAR